MLSALAMWHFGPTVQALAAIVMIWALIAAFMIDADTQLLPDQITLPLLWAGILVNMGGAFVDLQTSVIGAVAGYLSLWLVYWGFKFATGKEGMGYGDFKLLAAIGAWLGWKMLPVVIMLSSGLSARFGKRNVAIAGFALSALQACALYAMPPDAVWGMLGLHMLGSVFYAPTIAVMWAMYADAADYSEWQTGRRFTGMVFATIGFSLKSGLALGSACFLWVLAGFFGYDTQQPGAPEAIVGYRFMSSFGVGALFAACTLCLMACRLDKRTTLQMADELTTRRLKAGTAPVAA